MPNADDRRGQLMCGIVATTAGVGHLPVAMEAIATRGPDASGWCEADGIDFGHRRLSIIGLGAAGAQPMASDPDHVLVFNGEIYNYRALSADLRINAQSDTQVLYEIGRRREYPRWIHRLRGMFAFVHYDRVREELTIGRDPFGIKPLYVRTHADGEISIGSTVSSLAALGGILQPDGDSLAGFLGLGLFPAGASPFAGIVKVAPGTVATLKRGQGGWKGPSDQIEGRHWTHTPVREAVEDSVAAHLVADVEVGVLLSGGIDSDCRKTRFA